MNEFQFTPLREGRPGEKENPANFYYFNSRPSARGDAALARRQRISATYFNSRPSARGDCGKSTQDGTPLPFQFTPLREGRRRWRDGNVSARRISIHAPPRGATLTDGIRGNPNVFQFTPLREGRQWVELSIVVFLSNFNSRPSARGDIRVTRSSRSVLFQFTPLREGRQCRTRSGRKAMAISIHAPPRGATGGTIHRCVFVHFNSRPSARGDKSHSRQFRRLHISIHAPPRGATHAWCDSGALWNYFNSRPSARGDRRENPLAVDGFISIHAPPRGATVAPFVYGTETEKISIHAPPRGATPHRAYRDAP